MLILESENVNTSVLYDLVFIFIMKCPIVTLSFMSWSLYNEIHVKKLIEGFVWNFVYICINNCTFDKWKFQVLWTIGWFFLIFSLHYVHYAVVLLANPPGTESVKRHFFLTSTINGLQFKDLYLVISKLLVQFWTKKTVFGGNFDFFRPKRK